ncbi:8-amino-7-oxononanoate synthase [Rickettsiella endosymbiont of Rhagonycha lignosa]|uniref:aminotransferase class I/II-fold pyridoxal phosphate-dependent enzyme n=1 Tax=Rickettsiella endosymbiont of Rhagonycha lignosa TaxID=3077937 RepID=UPI00313B9F56
MHILQKYIHEYLQAREKKGLLRELTPYLVKNNLESLYLNFNDYLQLSKHPSVIQAAQKTLEIWGTSSGGSPAIASYWPIHQKLENSLKEWCGFEYGLLWNSGYTANRALLSTLPQKGDVVLADRYVHNSMLLGAQDSLAKLIRYQHLNLNHLEDLLRIYARPDRTIFVITESVFSMEGDYPDFSQMGFLKDRYNFFWIVDEAHALGWYGPKGNGLVAKFGVEKKVDILVATLGKALASQGAFTLFHNPDLRSYLLNRTPEFIYSTYLTPAATAASLAAIEIIQTEYVLRQSQWLSQTLKLKNRLKHFFPDIPLYDSPILPLVIGDPGTTLRLAAQLAEQHHIYVGAIRPPSVPKRTSRLRLSLHCNIEFSSLAQTLEDFFKKNLLEKNI